MSDLFEYKQEFDALHFTPEQKAQLVDRVVRAAEQKTHGRTCRPVRRIAVAAACLAAVLAVGAGATGVLRPIADVFAPVFGGSAAQTEVIDRIGRPVGASDTDKGVTITAEAIIGDQYNACIVYSIARDDGQPLLPDGISAKNLMLGGFGGTTVQGFGGSHGSARFLQGEGNTLQYVETISADKPIRHGLARADFEDLCYWDDEAGKTVTVVEGHWKFRFDMNYEDTSVSMDGGETFEQGGMTFTVDQVTVSPVAVRVDYTVDSEVVWSDAPSGQVSDEDRRTQERYFENVEILLTKTDVTVLDLTNSGGSIRPENGKTVCSKGEVLEEIVPLEEMESISVGGITYSLLSQ